MARGYRRPCRIRAHRVSFDASVRSVDFHPEAAAEFISAAQYFERHVENLGLDFILAVRGEPRGVPHPEHPTDIELVLISRTGGWNRTSGLKGPRADVPAESRHGRRSGE
jgi:hypothetical protein